jgi:hypothetical protein
MKRHMPKMHAFTMAFADPDHNEAPQARTVTGALGVAHYEDITDAGTVGHLVEIRAAWMNLLRNRSQGVEKK